jgi:hypothetical protein
VTFSAERVVLFLRRHHDGPGRVDAEALSYELGLPVEIDPPPGSSTQGSIGSANTGRAG